MQDYTMRKEDLVNTIKSLEKLYNYLLNLDPPGDTPEKKLENSNLKNSYLSDLNSVILTLSQILRDTEAAEIIIPGLSQEEYYKVGVALSELDRVIKQDQAFQEFIQTVTTILEGVATIAK